VAEARADVTSRRAMSAAGRGRAAQHASTNTHGVTYHRSGSLRSAASHGVRAWLPESAKPRLRSCAAAASAVASAYTSAARRVPQRKRGAWRAVAPAMRRTD
jgi:hypothetical protein